MNEQRGSYRVHEDYDERLVQADNILFAMIEAGDIDHKRQAQVRAAMKVYGQIVHDALRHLDDEPNIRDVAVALK